MGKTIGDIRKERNIGGPPLLHGEDLPRNVQSVKVKVADIREAPANFNSPAILDFTNEVYGKSAMALNISNLEALARKLGFKDPREADLDQIRERARGKTIELFVVRVNNPKLGKIVRSLAIEAGE